MKVAVQNKKILVNPLAYYQVVS